MAKLFDILKNSVQTIGNNAKDIAADPSKTKEGLLNINELQHDNVEQIVDMTKDLNGKIKESIDEKIPQAEKVTNAAYTINDKLTDGVKGVNDIVKSGLDIGAEKTAGPISTALESIKETGKEFSEAESVKGKLEALNDGMHNFLGKAIDSAEKNNDKIEDVLIPNETVRNGMEKVDDFIYDGLRDVNNFAQESNQKAIDNTVIDASAIESDNLKGIFESTKSTPEYGGSLDDKLTKNSKDEPALQNVFDMFKGQDR